MTRQLELFLLWDQITFFKQLQAQVQLGFYHRIENGDHGYGA